MMRAAYASLSLRLSFSLVAYPLLCAEQLPVKTYTTADGLARNNVGCIVQDGRGFLWFCTTGGLSRFDGYTFINYGPETGLSKDVIKALKITRDGVYWVGTLAGLFRLDPSSPPPQKFEPVRVGANDYARQIRALLEDRSGGLWVATMDGLYRLEKGSKTQFQPVDIGIPKRMDGSRPALTLTEDRQGALWIAGTQLYQRTPNGRSVTYSDERFKSGLLTIHEDRQGALWAGGNGGLFRLSPGAGPNNPIVARAYTMKDGLPGNVIDDLMETSDGRFWVAATGGLGVYVTSADRFEGYTTAQGLSDPSLSSLAEDNEGNLWVATDFGGVMRIARQGFTSYTQSDGLTTTRIMSLFVDQAGDLCAQTSADALADALGQFRSLDCFDGKHFQSARPRYPRRIQYFGSGWNQTVLQDHNGEWWIATGQGLCRFGRAERAAQLAGRAPKAVYTIDDGLPANDIYRLFEDSRGDIWVSTLGNVHNPLARWERTTGRFRVYSEADGLPRVQPSPSAYAEDSFGQIWIGLRGRGLARFRNGRFTVYSESDGVPAGIIVSLYLDRAGRLWIGATLGGLARIDNPAEARPHFVTYTAAEGLSSDTVRSIVEDQWGRIYAGTARGLDRLDPTTGHMKHYTTADGLPRGELLVSRRDRQGALWFGSVLGLSRLVPTADPPSAPPPILISGVRVRGVAQPLYEIGQTSVAGLMLQPNQNQLQLDFVGIAFAPGESLRYQYRLKGVDNDWSPPTAQRSVNYASLKPGVYRFEVRALNTEAAVSAEPASVAFTILAPIWQRWWFLSVGGMALCLLIYILYRYRVEQLLGVERIRSRIATDLHDDIGSSLSQIAILSEVARRESEDATPRVARPLSEIAAVSGELVDAMSDIVWAINPNHDHLSNLEYRMRRFATDVFTACNIDLEFRAMAVQPDLRIGADVRRQLFLIFKEAVNNIARHSGASLAAVEFGLVQEHLVLKLIDNGTGFDPAAGYEGNGLINIRKRASDLGGTAVFESLANRGTTLTLRVPLAYQGWWGRKSRK